MARRMLFPAGLMVLIVVLVHEACSGNDSDRHSCPPCCCGNIQNIWYPFHQLDGNPPICGDHRYNLSCENNQTVLVLYLYAEKYDVLEIDYIAYTIIFRKLGFLIAWCGCFIFYLFFLLLFFLSYWFLRLV
jgi:hypothetical protein